MRKNRMMRAASALMVAVLLTTSTISGTFAKYVTQDSASDTARVAKWGVELQAVGNLYGETYGLLTDNKIVKDDSSEDKFSVQSNALASDVVAPGTKNDEGFTFSLKGQPEVDGKITTTMTAQNIFLGMGEYGVMIPVDADVVTEGNFDEFDGSLYHKVTVDAEEYYQPATVFNDSETYYTLEDYVYVTANYYPVVYTLAGNTTSSGDTTADSLKAAADAVATQLGLGAATINPDTSVTYTGVKTFEAHTNLDNTLKLDGITLTWEWAFDGINDGADTILGMLKNTVEGEVVVLYANGYKAPIELIHYCLNTRFEIDVTVEQTD